MSTASVMGSPPDQSAPTGHVPRDILSTSLVVTKQENALRGLPTEGKTAKAMKFDRILYELDVPPDLWQAMIKLGGIKTIETSCKVQELRNYLAAADQPMGDGQTKVQLIEAIVRYWAGVADLDTVTPIGGTRGAVGTGLGIVNDAHEAHNANDANDNNPALDLTNASLADYFKKLNIQPTSAEYSFPDSSRQGSVLPSTELDLQNASKMHQMEAMFINQHEQARQQHYQTPWPPSPPSGRRGTTNQPTLPSPGLDTTRLAQQGSDQLMQQGSTHPYVPGRTEIGNHSASQIDPRPSPQTQARSSYMSSPRRSVPLPTPPTRRTLPVSSPLGFPTQPAHRFTPPREQKPMFISATHTFPTQPAHTVTTPLPRIV
ncbi:hypothetical protein F5Y08DRAFT_109393 [Xylaria arbuscula]|nr:hypothetical protein F5Y08DRAFT_109393 [Xylaria arbuscula]